MKMSVTSIMLESAFDSAGVSEVKIKYNVPTDKILILKGDEVITDKSINLFAKGFKSKFLQMYPNAKYFSGTVTKSGIVADVLNIDGTKDNYITNF